MVKYMSTSRWALLIGFLLVSLVLVCIKMYPTSFRTIDGAVSEIHLLQNPSNQNETDVYLRNSKTGIEKQLFSLPDIYRDHYHPAEFFHGKVFVIRRSGGEEAQRTNSNW